MGQKGSHHAPAVDRALDIIELLAVCDREIALSEILERLPIPRQSLIRILNTLCDRGIVDRSIKRGHYRLGMKLLYFGNRIQDNIRLRSEARPFMEKLAETTHKTVELTILDRDQLILIEQIEGSEGIRLYTRIGSAYPYFHAVAVGKIYLAHMAPDKRRKVLSAIGLPAVTEHTITRQDRLEEALNKTMEKGFAVEDQELRKGVRRIAAPIYDHRNQLAGCVGVAATVFSLEKNHIEGLGRQVKDTARQISNRMGYVG
jgi:DNA-binding IclR family transcriptional regulator